ncbi:MAG: hypothetical protein KJ944_08525 [Alphaproteobacteria bacterium]|nr:hypothetical protein [Alphaproteobacteria bacterium]MBU1561540.1 hypothetical protein [Alphaproteobacteria bacterium]MBU2302627.1 hypothetical protein [Alphaproteobacteria bacterium]MBU2367701.1 hypothetical protein [Alphaproteobacteria bacterium]
MDTTADNIKFKFADLGRFAVLKMPTDQIWDGPACLVTMNVPSLAFYNNNQSPVLVRFDTLEDADAYARELSARTKTDNENRIIGFAPIALPEEVHVTMTRRVTKTEAMKPKFTPAPVTPPEAAPFVPVMGKPAAKGKRPEFKRGDK